MVEHEWKIAGLPTHEGGYVSKGGVLAGKQWQPRDLVTELFGVGFKNAYDLSTALKVLLAESQGYDHAYNDNLDATGKVVSRDVGVMQINIPASEIGTAVETDLYDVRNNVDRGFSLFTARHFQPWVAFNTHVYLRDTYVKRANKGIANWLCDNDLKLPTDTLNNGEPYVHSLTTPAMDYMYRVVEQHVEIENAIELTKKLQAATSITVEKGIAAQLRALLSSAANIYKE